MGVKPATSVDDCVESLKAAEHDSQDAKSPLYAWYVDDDTGRMLQIPLYLGTVNVLSVDTKNATAFDIYERKGFRRLHGAAILDAVKACQSPKSGKNNK